MKCNNCGAPLQLDQKFCPNCGSPNEQGLKHANDMENYNKKFNRTRSKVISNSKWFVKNITPIAVVMLSAIVLAAALIANNSMFGYRVTERDNKRYNKTHNDEIQVQLKELLDNDALLNFRNRALKAICGVKEADDSSSSYSWDDNLNRAARAVVDLEDTMNRVVSYDTGKSKESISYIENVYNKAHLFIKAYCDFTDEDIAGLPDMNQTEVITLLTRRLYG